MKAVFLDRDGVINRNPGDKEYVTSWKKFSFLPGVKRAIAKFRRHGYKVFIISNQAGVGKGIFTKKSLWLISANMLDEIRKAGGDIEGIHYCIHRPNQNCRCRKPKAAIFRRVARRYRINLARTFFIGDTIRDVQAAENAGCRSILVLSGREKLKRRLDWQNKPDLVFSNLLKATKYILRKKRAPHENRSNLCLRRIRAL